MSGSRQYSVIVDGETVEVWVAKEKGTYRAWAFFRGRQITVRGGSESSAIGTWRDEANHRANE